MHRCAPPPSSLRIQEIRQPGSKPGTADQRNCPVHLHPVLHTGATKRHLMAQMADLHYCDTLRLLSLRGGGLDLFSRSPAPPERTLYSSHPPTVDAPSQSFLPSQPVHPGRALEMVARAKERQGHVVYPTLGAGDDHSHPVPFPCATFGEHKRRTGRLPHSYTGPSADRRHDPQILSLCGGPLVDVVRFRRQRLDYRRLRPFFARLDVETHRQAVHLFKPETTDRILVKVNLLSVF